MDAAHRRREILNILLVRRHVTTQELAHEMGVCIRTIGYDIQILSLYYPIYSRQGGCGGIFIEEHYKPYINTLTANEFDILCELFLKCDEKYKKVLAQILCKYGPDKFKLEYLLKNTGSILTSHKE